MTSNRSFPLPVRAFAALGVCLPLHVAQAQSLMLPASEEPPAAPTSVQASPVKDRWVLGATLSSTPSYTGGTERSIGLRPVLAGRVGRWMISSSSARGLAGIELAGGVSTTVVQDERWSVGVGARLTHGRSSTDDPMLSGLPDIKSSLGVRVAARYVLAPGWRVTAAAQQDLLKSQGMRANLGLGWAQPVGGGWVLDVNGGINLANARAMNTFFGVPEAGARVGRPAWQSGGGLESWYWGAGVSRALSPHWRVAGSIGRSTLLGNAARSPLTLQRSGNVAQISLAYVGW